MSGLTPEQIEEALRSVDTGEIYGLSGNGPEVAETLAAALRESQAENARLRGRYVEVAASVYEQRPTIDRETALRMAREDLDALAVSPPADESKR